MTHILFAEDEPTLALAIVDRLAANGYEVDHVTTGTEAVRRAPDADLILLDIMLPGMDGFEVCRALRRSDLAVPILMLTARSHVADRVAGLRLGADDYLTKPFEMPELLARIEALLRRARPAVGGRVTFGDVVADFAAAVVRRGAEEVALTSTELRLLQYLASKPNVLVSRDELLDRVWGYGADVYSRTVDVHIASLRQKLERVPSRPRHILTVHGMGYRFVA